MPKTTRPGAKVKPSKPWPEFPLFAHAVGQWAKKVRGRLHYFGPWANHAEALAKWNREKDDLLAGRSPRPVATEGATVADLCNHFCTLKKNRVDSGELAPRTYALYYSTCERLVAEFTGPRRVADLVAQDFEKLRKKLAKRWGPVAIGNEIQRVRCVFHYGFEAGLIDTPVRFGPGFKKPSAKTMRKARQRHGARMFEAAEVVAILEHAGPNMKAMILLGLNAAMGNTDLALLPVKALDLRHGWLNYPREKTAIDRHIPLWPETVEALKAAMAARKALRDEESKPLVFVGPRGENYIGAHRGYRVGQEFERALVAAKLNGPGRSFYNLRRTFQTIAEGAHDLAAVQAIMGHAPRGDDMSAVYRQRIDDERLRIVVDHVRGWLWPKGTSEQGTAPAILKLFA